MNARKPLRGLVLLGLALAFAGCAGTDGGPDTAADDTVSAGDTAAPDATPDATGDVPTWPAVGDPPFRAFFAVQQTNVLQFEVNGGHWTEDFGDAAFYGPAYFARAGVAGDRDDLLALAREGAAYSGDVVRQSADDMGFFLAHLDEGLMAAFGVMEYTRATGHTAASASADRFIDRVNQTADAFGIYLDVDIASYALDTYGPTTVTAVVALLNLRAADLLGGPRAEERVAHAVTVIDAVDEHAWDGERYRFRPDDEKLFLYPNVVMLAANAIAFERTGEERFRERCLAIHAAIQPLHDAEKGAYRSPYSAVYMGAHTEDYLTLSSQNFTMMGLTKLYDITGDAAYLAEVAAIAAFVEGWIYDPAQHRILHHWMDGGIAQPGDPEYWCSGCNLQFLYVLDQVEP